MARHLRYFGLLIVVCSLVPASEGLAAPGRSDRSYRCRSLNVRSTDTSAKIRRRRRVRTFRATEVLDLEIRVRVPRAVSGEHRLALKVYTPNGHLYQTLSVPITATESSNDETSSRRRRRSRWQAVSATLPVAGTTIVTSSLYGAWSVEAYLDDSTQTCTTPRKFAVEP